MRADASRSMLGVLVSGGPEPAAMREAYYRSLAALAPRYGLSAVLVCIHAPFCPDSGRNADAGLRCYRLREETWIPLEPERLRLDAIYDRFFARGPRDAAAASAFIRDASRRWGCRRLGGALPDKWKVHLALRDDAAIRPLLPATAPLRTPMVPEWLRRNGGRLLIKPAAGMQGRGVVKLCVMSDGRVEAQGRDAANRPFAAVFQDVGGCIDWLDRLISKRYVAQQLLDLRDPLGRPFDVRLLVQKDAGARWSATGAAVRAGRAGGVTANLSGGGTALNAEPFLAEHFGDECASKLLAGIESAGLLIARRLESRFGRLAELGLDFGIDIAGRLWFLEANSKPGRSAFRQLGGAAASLSVERPLQYARYLIGRREARRRFVSRPLPAAAGGSSKDHVQEVHV